MNIMIGQNVLKKKAFWAYSSFPQYGGVETKITVPALVYCLISFCYCYSLSVLFPTFELLLNEE